MAVSRDQFVPERRHPGDGWRQKEQPARYGPEPAASHERLTDGTVAALTISPSSDPPGGGPGIVFRKSVTLEVGLLPGYDGGRLLEVPNDPTGRQCAETSVAIEEQYVLFATHRRSSPTGQPLQSARSRGLGYEELSVE